MHCGFSPKLACLSKEAIKKAVIKAKEDSRGKERKKPTKANRIKPLISYIFGY